MTMEEFIFAFLILISLTLLLIFSILIMIFHYIAHIRADMEVYHKLMLKVITKDWPLEEIKILIGKEDEEQ